MKSFDEFEAHYGLEEFPETETGVPYLLETYGSELERVKSTKPDRVWTVLDGDDGELYVCAGFHFVNRVHYIITKKPWETGTETYRY